MRVGIVIACLAAVLSAGDQEEAIRAVVADIQRAEKERDPDAALRHVDVEAFRARLALAGVTLPDVMLERASRRLFAGDQLGGFQGARIRLVEVAADGKSAKCVVDHGSGVDGARIRWWFTRTATGWRLYEGDVVDMGLTLSQSFALGFRATREPKMREFFPVFRKVHALVAQEEYGAVIETVDAIDVDGLPAWARMTLVYMRTASLVAVERNEEALRISEALLAEADAPPAAHLLHASALLGLGRSEESLEAARIYIDAVGPSSAAAFVVASAHLALERKDRALEACKEGLALDPADADLLVVMAVALPDDRKREIAGYLKALDDLEETLPSIVAEVVDHDDRPALEALAVAAQTLAKDGAVAAYARGHALYAGEKYDDAAAAFKRAYERADESWHEHYVLWYLDAMAEARRVVEAFNTAPDRKAAFDYLAAHVASMERPDDLAKLVAARAPDKDKTPVFWIWDAQARFDAGDYDGALAVLSRHAKVLADFEDDNSWRVDEVKVKALVRLGRLVEADAASQDVDKLLRLVVVLATGDLAKSTAAFKDALDDDWTLEEIWDDEDVAHFLKTDKMKPLRDKYPQPKETDE